MYFVGNIQINYYNVEGVLHELEENGQLVQFTFNREKDVVTETKENVTNRLSRQRTDCQNCRRRVC